MNKHFVKDVSNPFHTKHHSGMVHIAWGLTNEECKLELYEGSIKTKHSRKLTGDDRRSIQWDKRVLSIKSNTLSPPVVEFLLALTNEDELKQALSRREEVAHDDRPTSKSNFVRLIFNWCIQDSLIDTNTKDNPYAKVMAQLRWNEELGDYQPVDDDFKVGLGNRIDRLYTLLKSYPVSNALFEASLDESIDSVNPTQTFKYSSNSIRQLSIAVNFIRSDYF